MAIISSAFLLLCCFLTLLTSPPASAASLPAKPSVGVITVGNPIGPIVAYLENTGEFGFINGTDAGTWNVTSEWMALFDVILYFSNNDLPQPDTFGNHLANYLDEGGAVVTGLFQIQTCCPGSIAGGRFASEYQVIVPNVKDANPDVTYVGDIYFPQHPVMQEFLNFTTAATNPPMAHMVFANNSLEPNSYILGRFLDNTYLVAVRDSVGPGKRNRVDIGYWPFAAFESNATGAKTIVVQALLYALSSPYISWPSQSTTCTVPSVANYLPSVLGLSVVSQKPAALSTVQSGQTTTMSFTVNLPGPTVMSGSIALTCPGSSPSSSPSPHSNAASRTSNLLLERILLWI